MDDEHVDSARARHFVLHLTQVVEDEHRRRSQPSLELARGDVADDQNPLRPR